MRASWYAKTLAALEDSGALSEPKILDQFIAVVEQNGHTHMLRKIIRGYERIIARKTAHETIEVTTASAISEAEVATLLRTAPFAQVLSPEHKRVIRKVDPTLIGGAVARTDRMRIDASYKRTLADLYHSLVT